ncbi:MAG: DUF5702 domain-containing protein [Lachnospiraceae bacterium]|nr:DUF5702 domain-containing protein [Lachnospiraceae bacterium]
MCKSLKKSKGFKSFLELKKSGSITVFLSLIFVVLIVMIFVFIDVTRIVSSKSYVKTAAQNSLLVSFGQYNREMYEDYNLFTFGGCNEIGVKDLQYNIETVLKENLKERPEKNGRYTSFYRLSDCEANIEMEGTITETDEFFRQIKAYVKYKKALSALKNITAIGEQINDVTDSKDDISKDVKIDDELLDDNKNKEDKKERNTKDNSKDKVVSKEENPLKTLNVIFKEGWLSNVLEVNTLSDKDVSIDKLSEENSKNNIFSFNKKSNSNKGDVKNSQKLMKKYLNSFEGFNITDSDITNKGAYLLWAEDFMKDYTTKEKGDICEMEYIICGHNNDRDNMTDIVNRLLLFRCAINYITISGDPLLQNKSLTTAEAIASLILLPEIAPALSKVILFLMAVEESMVDVRALLDGREINLMPSSSTLKMKYEEICIANKELYERKAKEYEEAKNSSIAKGKINYKYVINLFILMTQDKKLVNRTCEIIQHNLRNDYNETFDITSAITYSNVNFSYDIPYIFSGILGNKLFSDKLSDSEFSLEYGYFL